MRSDKMKFNSTARYESLDKCDDRRNHKALHVSMHVNVVPAAGTLE